MRTLEKIKIEASKHSFDAEIIDEHVMIKIPYVEKDGSKGLEYIQVKSFKELYIALGY